MDFQGIKNRVEEERKRRATEGEQRGDTMTMPRGNAPKDSLLHELQLSLQTGKATPMVENMKQVDRVANSKSGASGRPAQGGNGGGGLGDVLSQHIGAPPKQQQGYDQQQPPRQQINEQQHNPRDDQFDRQFQQRPSSQASLSEQLSQMGGSGQMNPQQQMMEAYQKMQGTQQPMNNQQPQQQPQYNGGNINEQVSQALNNVDFSSLLQESLKSTIMEMYSMEKVQKSLIENKDVIKKIVKETLIELSQAKKKTTG